MIYGGAVQIIVGFMEYIRGNGFTGAVFCSYGSFFLGIFINNVLAGQKIVTGGADAGGVMLWYSLWGVLTLCFFLFTLRKPIGLQLVFFSLTIAFFLLAAGVKHPKATQAGGYFAFFTGVVAIYTAMAILAAEEYSLVLPGTQTLWPYVPKAGHASPV